MSDLSQIPTEQLLAMLNGHAAAQQQIANDQISQGAKNFAQDMPLYQQMGAGAGKALTDMARGAGQLTGIIPQQSIDEAAKRDAPLMNTSGGVAGNILGNIGALSATALIPGANTFTGSGAIGGVLGALSPTKTGESRTLNVLGGVGAGLAGTALAKGVSTALRPITSSLSPEEAQLASVAMQNGIPLRASQLTGSKPLKIMDSVMENLPVTSGPQLAAKRTQQEAFTRAALLRAGANSSVATPEVLQAQKNALGSTFEDISGRNNVRLFTPAEMPQAAVTDWQMLNKAAPVDRAGAGVLDSIARDAQTKLPPQDAAKVSDYVNRILSQTDESGIMSGTNYQGWREPLRQLAKGNDATSAYFSQIRKALDSEFANQLSGADRSAFQDASQKYANLKAIMQAMGSSGMPQTVGQLPPSALATAITGQLGKERKALGYGDLTQLANAGKNFVSESIPDSATAQRQFYLRLLTGQVPGAAVGGAVGYSQGGVPGALGGAGVGAAAGMGGPRLAQMMINSPAGQKYLTNGLLDLSPAQRSIMTNLLRSSPVAGALTLENQ